VNPICPICGLYELNDGSEDTLYTCECECRCRCDYCNTIIKLDEDPHTYFAELRAIYCKECSQDYQRRQARSATPNSRSGDEGAE